MPGILKIVKVNIMNFSIVIPVFNEAGNIGKLLNEINFILKKDKKLKFELLIVNDASTDDTLKEINNYLKTQNNVSVLNNYTNLGQSYSITQGIKNSKYETIVTIDGDGQNNPKDIPILLNRYFLDKDLYLVGGIRNKRQDNHIKILSSKIANNFRQLILNDNCPDTGCSLKVFDKNTYLKFPYFNGIHRFLPALFKGYNKKTFFINVDHRKRVAGKSNYGTFKRLFYGLIDVFKVLSIINKFKNTNA